MRIEKLIGAEFCNRKKQIIVKYYSGKEVTIHYGGLGIEQNISRIDVDKETKGKSLVIEFNDGSIDYLPYDQPLAIVKDPEYVLQAQIEVLIAHINDVLKQKKISKKYLAEQLETSENQVHRLLNPSILNKNLMQLYKIVALLGMDCEIALKDVA